VVRCCDEPSGSFATELVSYGSCSAGQEITIVILAKQPLLCSHEPVIGLYPDPFWFTLIYPMTLRSILILFSPISLALPSGLFPFGFQNTVL
jgi:hypothetical protein